MIQTLFHIVIVAFFSFSGNCLAGEQIVVGNFSGQPQNGVYPEHWETQVFDGVNKHTVYTHVSNGNINSIQATSRGSCAGLVRKIHIDPSLYSTVSFRWKIQDIIRSADLTCKEGDDAPARVWITFGYDPDHVSWWEMVKFEGIKLLYNDYPPIAALVYVWASHEEQGAIIENPYADRVKIIVLQSGPEKKGQWISEKRDIRADYRAAFGAEDIPMISGVAIMTDTDDTGGQAVAWYGDIIFSNSPVPLE